MALGCGSRPPAENERRKKKQKKEPPCASAPRATSDDSPRNEQASMAARHLTTYTDSEHMQKSLRPQSRKHGNRARRVSRPDMRRSLNKKALIARTASHLPEALQAQIEKTKLELDTLIKQDLERQRKKSRSLVLSVEQLLALLEAFEELCTDEDKWRYLVYEVDRCMKNVRDLISGFQQQSMLKRAVAFRQNSSNYNELTLDIGETIRTLKISLSGAGPGLRAASRAHPDHHVAAAAVRQIPQVTRGFVGRGDLLSHLSERIASSTDSRKVCVLSGLHGVGKTDVAVALANEWAEEYPDAHFFADLMPSKDDAELVGSVRRLSGSFRRRSSADHSFIIKTDSNLATELTEGRFESLNVSETMRMVVRARVGDAAALADASATELRALYHDVFCTTKNILILENAIDPEQVNALLPRTGDCLVIVTSIRNLSESIPNLTAAERVGALSDPDAAQMLKLLVPRLMPADLAEISGLCGNMPLALQMVGGALSVRPDIAPSKLTKQMRKGAEEGLHGSLRVSYEFLTDGASGSRATLQQLSVFPETFDVAAAQAILDLDQETTEEHLGELLVNHFIEHAPPVEGRYRMREVIKQFALSMRGQGWSTKIYEEKYMQHFFAQVKKANVVARHNKEVARNLWDHDRVNMVKALQLAERTPVREFEVAWSSRTILRLCYPAKERIGMYGRCVRMAEQSRDNEKLAPMLVELAHAHNDAGDVARAREYYDKRKAIRWGPEPKAESPTLDLERDLGSPITLALTEPEVAEVQAPAHSLVEDEETLHQLEQALEESASPRPDDDDAPRSATISTLSRRLRRNTLTRASSVEPLNQYIGDDDAPSAPPVAQRRKRQISASYPSPAERIGLEQWPGATSSQDDTATSDEPFAGVMDVRTRSERSSSDGSDRRRSGSGELGLTRSGSGSRARSSAAGAPTLPTVPQSPATSSMSGTPTPGARDSNDAEPAARGSGGAAVALLPPALDLGGNATDRAEGGGSAEAPDSPPTPQNTGSSGTKSTPPAGSFVDSPILIAAQSVLQRDDEGVAVEAVAVGSDASAVRRCLVLPEPEPEPEPDDPEMIFGDLSRDKDLRIEYSELEWAGEEKARARVAEGAIGQVYRAVHQGQDVAVKEFKELFSPQQEEDTEALKEFKAEVELLSSCRCPNIVLFVGYCFERADAERNAPYRLAIVTEYMARGSLWDNLHRRRNELRPKRRVQMLHDIVKGMQYLRHKKIIHCDLKTPNLLVDRAFLIKIADFGFARMQKNTLAKTLSGDAGTPMWMAPEVLLNERFTFKADVYSFGVIVWCARLLLRCGLTRQG